jgi:hypothetical protein
VCIACVAHGACVCVQILWPCDMDASVGIQQANAVQAAACALVMLSECGEYDVGKGPEVNTTFSHYSHIYAILDTTSNQWCM